MFQALSLASPSTAREAPNHIALNKTTNLIIEGQPLSTPPFAQEYFEPGVNTKLTRRKKPKTDYTLPSDMPKYPMGFVPTNQTPGPLAGQEPPLIKVKETVPGDLIEVFARIAAEENALASLPKFKVDSGTILMREYTDALKEARAEKKAESMLNEGFTPVEVDSAMNAVRMEEAVKKAKEPPKPVSVETALAEKFGIGTQTDVTVEGGKVLYARRPRRTAEEVGIERAEAMLDQHSITKFFPKK